MAQIFGPWMGSSNNPVPQVTTCLQPSASVQSFTPAQNVFSHSYSSQMNSTPSVISRTRRRGQNPDGWAWPDCPVPHRICVGIAEMVNPLLDGPKVVISTEGVTPNKTMCYANSMQLKPVKNIINFRHMIVAKINENIPSAARPANSDHIDTG